jgi:ceramide glucosyltransferase
MSPTVARVVDCLASLLAALYALDRLLKLAAVIAFFRRLAPPPAAHWPSVSMLQPITRGASNLGGALRARAQLDYPAQVQHLLICDEADSASQALCQEVLTAYPTMGARIILVPSPDGVASKIQKLLAALPAASGEVLCFVDDDVLLRPLALQEMLPYLAMPGAGAVFGLACYTDWRTPWSSLMSAFVNANALMSYIPVTYLTQPFTITGHCFAIARATFERAGGLAGLERSLGDDHQLALRLRQIGLRSVQTPMIYDVDNDFPTFRAYNAQMKRWFVFPRQMLLPFLGWRERLATLVGSIGTLIPGVLALLALAARRRAAWKALGVSLSLFCLSYALGETRYLKRRAPRQRWPLIPLVALLAPVQILWALLSSNEIEWRGRRLRVLRGDTFEVLRTANKHSRIPIPGD